MAWDDKRENRKSRAGIEGGTIPQPTNDHLMRLTNDALLVTPKP